MARMATKLYTARQKPCALAPMVMMSDPLRMPDIANAARRLPQGAALIYRHFGKVDKVEEAEILREITAQRSQQFLIGHDPELAEQVGADGVHFKRSADLALPLLWRDKKPDWLITMAGLKEGEYTAALSSLDALFISSVFPSQSPSAGEPIGIEAFTKKVKSLDVPVFALGGVNAKTASKTVGTGAAGLAGIDGFMETKMSDIRIETEQTSYGHRFVARLEGFEKTGELTMKKIKTGLYNANHTGVPKSMGGKGVGKALVKYLSEHARENNYRVIPGCPFIGVMWKRHPDWAEGVRA